MSVSKEFQNRINDLVSEINVKKSKLPSEIGVDYRSLSNATKYGIVPTPKILMRIADYFNISIKYLLGQTDDEYFSKAKEKTTFHIRYEALLSERNIKSYKLAKDCHFSNSYISYWLKNNYLPSLEFLEIISDYFQVTVDYLLGRTDDRN